MKQVLDGPRVEGVVLLFSQPSSLHRENQELDSEVLLVRLVPQDLR